MHSSGTRLHQMTETMSELRFNLQQTFQLHFAQALTRRALAHDSQTRQQLQSKLDRLTQPSQIKPDRHAHDNIAAGEDHTVNGRDAMDRGAPAALSGLLEYIASQSSSQRTFSTDDPATSTYPELAALEHFRKIASQLRLQSQVRLTMQPAPADAGPLNSTTLVHRSLVLMRETAPEYLLQFLSYIDTLARMEQLSELVSTASKPAQPSKRPSKRGSNKSKVS